MLIKLIKPSEKNPRESKTFPSSKHRYFVSELSCSDRGMEAMKQQKLLVSRQRMVWSLFSNHFVMSAAERSILNLSSSPFSVCSRLTGRSYSQNEPRGTESLLLPLLHLVLFILGSSDLNSTDIFPVNS